MLNCLTAASIACFSFAASTVPRCWVWLRMMSTDQRGMGQGGGIASNFGIEIISLTQANCERAYN